MKKFETPIAEIEKFAVADIITASVTETECGSHCEGYTPDENELP